MRVGATSVASIDSDTSMAMTMVACSRGTRTGRDGLAKAMAKMVRAMRKATAGTWRRQAGRRGAMRSRRARLVNRTA
jgi:hypothetical protein